MKKLLALTVLAALLGTAAPLTPTQAASFSLANCIKYDYPTGYRMGQIYMGQCPTVSYDQWEQKRAETLQKSYDAFVAGRMDEADYWNGYYDGLGDDYAVYC